MRVRRGTSLEDERFIRFIRLSTQYSSRRYSLILYYIFTSDYIGQPLAILRGDLISVPYDCLQTLPCLVGAFPTPESITKFLVAQGDIVLVYGKVNSSPAPARVHSPLIKFKGLQNCSAKSIIRSARNDGRFDRAGAQFDLRNIQIE
jgi:hypothetical protein